MIEILDSAVALGGVLLGFIIGRRERNLRRPTLYPCDCSHSLSKHRDSTRKNGTKDTSCMECSCQQYIGQRPVDPLQLDR